MKTRTKQNKIFIGKFSPNDTFGQRLKALRAEKMISQMALAFEIKVGKSIISAWELDKAEPTLSNLIKLAQFFDVSIDFLAGLEY